MGTVKGLSIKDQKLDVQLYDGNFKRDSAGVVSLQMHSNGGLSSTSTGVVINVGTALGRSENTVYVIPDGKTIIENEGLAVDYGDSLNYDGKLNVKETWLNTAIDNRITHLLDDGQQGLDTLRAIVDYLTDSEIDGATLANSVQKLIQPAHDSGLLYDEDDGLKIRLGTHMELGHIDGDNATDPYRIGVNFRTLSGLGLKADALAGNIEVKAGNGISVDSDGVHVILGTGMGFKEETKGVYVMTQGGGIDADTNGLFVNTRSLAGDGLTGESGIGGKLKINLGTGMTFDNGSLCVDMGNGLTRGSDGKLTINVGGDMQFQTDGKLTLRLANAAKTADNQINATGGGLAYISSGTNNTAGLSLVVDSDYLGFTPDARLTILRSKLLTAIANT